MCGCGQVETEEHILFECNGYRQEREQWRGTIERLKEGMCEYKVIKWYHVVIKLKRNQLGICECYGIVDRDINIETLWIELIVTVRIIMIKFKR